MIDSDQSRHQLRDSRDALTRQRGSEGRRSRVNGRGIFISTTGTRAGQQQNDLDRRLDGLG